METKLFIYRPGQERETQVLDLPQFPGLVGLRQVLRPLLDSADLEQVSVLFEGRRADMFVDDESATKGLPLNEAATAIYRAWSLKRDPDTDPDSLPAIFGPAVIFDRIVWS